MKLCCGCDAPLPKDMECFNCEATMPGYDADTVDVHASPLNVREADYIATEAWIVSERLVVDGMPDILV
jgi:hypothetical protein